MELERKLVAELTGGCERVVAGYTVRRERFSSEFSQGVENVAQDSHTGINSAIFVRTVKLKDFPWNGWLRVGIAAKPAAAWNPIGGLRDPAGRLIWAALGDPALLPAPYGATWVANRATATSVAMDGDVAVPEDALVPEPGTGLPREVGKGKTARARITYRVVASAFHDNTRMTAADAVYPYLFAARWGAKRPGGGDYDAASTPPRRRRATRCSPSRWCGVDSEVKKYSDITFTYVVPVIEVYVHRAVPGPAAAGGGGAALEHRALARAGADGRGGQARGGRVLGGGGESPRRPLARPGPRREDEGGAHRARRRLRPAGVCPREPQALRRRPTRRRTAGTRSGSSRSAAATSS